VTAIFIHIPKTGGMSISKALNVTKYRNRRRLVKGQEYEGIVTFGHELLPYLQRRGLAPRDAFTFAFVRNPYDRVVSLWAFNNKRNEMDLTFTEFCRRLDEWGWRIKTPQARWLDGLVVNFVGRFESLQDDFERLCYYLKVERSKALPHLNRGERGRCGDHYTDETRAIVRAHYARDFAELGYDGSVVPG
jgi:hypothetical protein